MKKYSYADTFLNANLYEKFLRIGIDDGWTTEDKLENFEQFLQIYNFTNTSPEKTSVLDAGCGTGDFAYFLEQHHVQTYCGIDIFAPAIKKAQMKYPNCEFILGDFFSINLAQYDFVYSSGALTTTLNSDNYIVLKNWLAKMWEVANKGIVFNCLLQRFPGDRDDAGLFLYDRLRVMEIAAGISKSAQMKTLVTDAGCGDGTEELHIYLFD